jgi:predicted DNA-binding transcriptional regulator YafY
VVPTISRSPALLLTGMLKAARLAFDLESDLTGDPIFEMSWHLFTWGDEVEIIKPKRLVSMLQKQLETCSAQMTT